MSSPHAKSILQKIFGGSLADTGYYGLKDLSNAAFVDEVFTNTDEYDAARKANLVTHYTRHPVHVRRSFPRQEAEYPCVIIQRIRDAEGEGPIGDVFSQTVSGGQKVTCYGTRFSETYEIYIASANSGGPLQRDEIYEAVKFIFVRARLFFEQQGLRNIRWSSGSDGEIDVPREKRPLIIHTASITLDFMTESTYTVTTATNDAATHIDSDWINPDTGEGDVTIAKYENL